MTINTCRVAALQMTSGPNVADNLKITAALLDAAAQRRTQIAVLPENFSIMPGNDRDRLAAAETADGGPVQLFLANYAKRRGIWIVAGSIPMKSGTDGKVRSACFVFDANGDIAVRYDKIHLFDVQLDNGEAYRESSYIEPGTEPVVIDTPAGRLGVTICYDVRFPEMFRKLTDLGAEWFVVPSAFTATTGRAHWEVLLRARAVENLAYVVAPAQVGLHANGRRTHGDSMIVSPWGEVLSRLGHGSGVITADLDPARVGQTRKTFPTISHRHFAVS
jgi:nitrilase